LIEVTFTKRLSNLIIKLTKTPTSEDKASAGF